MIGSAIPGVGSVAGAVVGGVTSAPVRAGLGGLARRLGLSKAGGAAASSAAGGAAQVVQGATPVGASAASNLAGALIGDAGRAAPAASRAAATTEKQVASVSRKKNRGAGRREKIEREKQAAASAPVRTAKEATLGPNANEQALYDSADVDLPMRKGKSPAAMQSTDHIFPGKMSGAADEVSDFPARKGKSAAGGMQSGDSLFSGQVPGVTRPTEVGGAAAGEDILDLPGRKGATGPGAVQSGDSLFSGQVPGATRPTSAESFASAEVDADLPVSKPKDVPMLPGTRPQDAAMLPGTRQAAPAPGVNPAAPDPSVATPGAAPSAGPTTGAQAAKKMPGPPERMANIVTGGGDTVDDIKKLKDPSRLIDWAVGPAIGAAIGGAEGFYNYDSSKEKDPLLKETPFIARMKAAGEGAAKGAGYAAAGIAGERALVGIGKMNMSEYQKSLLPGPISLTEAFTKGFGSTAGASGTTSMGGISNRVTGAFDESSGYVAALRTDKGIKAEEAVSGKIRQVEREAAEATKKRAAAAASAPTATAPAAATAAPAAAAGATPTRRTVSAPPANFRPGSMTTPTPAPAASATAAPSSFPAGTPAAARNPASAAPAAAPAAPAPPPPSATVTAATAASNANAPRVQSRIQIEQLNKQREKIRNNTADSMMHLPDHMTPQRVSDSVNSARGIVDAGVIAATAVGALAGTPILMAKQAVHNYKEHILQPNEKTSQVSAGMSLRGPQIQNPFLSEGQATGEYGIRSTLDAQFGDGAIARNIIAAGVTTTVGGAAMFGAMGATSYGGGPGHPMNALQMRDPAVSAKAQMDADASNKIRMSDPSQLGLADAEEMYYSNPSMRPVQSRSRPGQYNDTGNLTLALSALRRG
jgi:hypothetical protein